MAQPGTDLPVPLRARTVSPTVPNAQAKPGQGGQRHCRQLPHARLTPDPAYAIEDNPRRVEREKTDIENLVHGDNGPVLCSPLSLRSPNAAVAGRLRALAIP